MYPGVWEWTSRATRAYQESIFHEIESYWDHSTGEHHSAFSPEDFVSNYLGTYVASQAIARSEGAARTSAQR